MKTRVKMVLSLLLIVVIAGASLLGGCAETSSTPSLNETSDANEVSLGSPPESTVPASVRINEEAMRIVNNIQITTYQHPTEVDEDKGIYKVDCSGLVDYVLKRVAEENYQKISYSNDFRPYAEDFYHYFTTLPVGESASPGDWCQIETLVKAQAGDIIVYEYDQATKDRKGTTGHVMIITSTPVKEKNGEYMVWVIDSANSGHGSDTRTSSGVGKGKMWFGVDHIGHPIYYRWSKPNGDRHSSGLLGITIGRAG